MTVFVAKQEMFGRFGFLNVAARYVQKSPRQWRGCPPASRGILHGSNCRLDARSIYFMTSHMLVCGAIRGRPRLRWRGVLALACHSVGAQALDHAARNGGKITCKIPAMGARRVF